jgi:hypothetical protein
MAAGVFLHFPGIQRKRDNVATVNKTALIMSLTRETDARSTFVVLALAGVHSGFCLKIHCALQQKQRRVDCYVGTSHQNLTGTRFGRVGYVLACTASPLALTHSK